MSFDRGIRQSIGSSLACKLSKDSIFGGKYLCKVDNSLFEKLRSLCAKYFNSSLLALIDVSI